jgi:hypothetical protein
MRLLWLAGLEKTRVQRQGEDEETQEFGVHGTPYVLLLVEATDCEVLPSQYFSGSQAPAWEPATSEALLRTL